MKFLLALILTGFATPLLASDLYGVRYQCDADSLLSDGDQYAVDSLLNIRVHNKEGKVTMTALGHVAAGREEGEEATKPYYNHFALDSLEASLSPRARKYTDDKYYRFREFNATSTTSFDGGGMWGYLVVEKDQSETPFAAHYVFKAGDHLGGTIHYFCHPL